MRVRIHLSTLDLTLFCYVFYLIWFMYLFLKCVLYSFLLKLCISEAWKISTKHLAYMNYVLGGYFSFFFTFLRCCYSCMFVQNVPIFSVQKQSCLTRFPWSSWGDGSQVRQDPVQRLNHFLISSLFYDFSFFFLNCNCRVSRSVFDPL